jgi:leucyl aminopeptidase
MASSTPVSIFAGNPTLSQYASGSFPVVPRSAGIAKVTVGAEGRKVNRLTFATKAEIKAVFGEGSLAAADSEQDGVSVQYRKEDGAEYRVLYASVGAKATIGSIRKAAVAAVTKARALKIDALDIEAPAVAEGVFAARAVATVVQAATLTNYQFDRYITTESKLPSFLHSIHVITSDAALQAEAATAATLAECTIFARDLVNERADEVHPARLEEVAQIIAKESGMQIFVRSVYFVHNM